MENKTKTAEVQGTKERKKEPRQFSVDLKQMEDLIKIPGLGEQFLKQYEAAPTEKFVILMAMARGALAQLTIKM